ncbi:MAG: SRPBCC domain-containing protein [Flavobacteriaceae bacterium]|jgi:hypothetical protein|nr:SRPBCC domain-containing protein [Flavobacteriaceae bacterium]
MQKEIKTEITINAQSEQIWKILNDFRKYPDWNPFIRYIKGDVEEGNKIRVKIEPPKSKGMTFTPIVLSKKENKELRWLGSFLFKGLFDGEHCLALQDNSNGTTTFFQSEKFSGILVGLFNLAPTKAGFEAMNLKLKELAEKQSVIHN